MRGCAGTLAALLALVLGACASDTEAVPEAGPTAPSSSSPASSEPPVPPELRVENPKDARGTGPCELLTEEQLVELGLLPDTGETGPIDAYESCTWQLADDPLDLASAGVNVGLTLSQLYTVPERFDVFEPVPDVTGHPTVRADINADGSCFLVVALGRDQLLGTGGNIAMRPLPDPCALPRRMAELILSNLPPAS